MSKVNFAFPSFSFMGKVAIALVVIVLVVKLAPTGWGIKSWFSVNG